MLHLVISVLLWFLSYYQMKIEDKLQIPFEPEYNFMTD